MNNTNKIGILLSTYNGQKYLKEQIDSILNQTIKDFTLFARDDGSCDTSIEILKLYGVIIIPFDKNLGACGSFATLLKYSLEYSECEYFMFCDQDDVWANDKIEKTIKVMKALEKENNKIPLLVHSDLCVVNENLEILDKSYWRYTNINPSYNSFYRIMMQNTVTGCTMMINKELALLVLPLKKEVIMHDWWIALVASYFGKIEYIKEPTILYRQHAKNEVGAQKFNFFYILKKVFSIFTRDENKKNIEQLNVFLAQYRKKLDDETLKKLEIICDLEKKDFFTKRKILFKYGLFKQGVLRNIALFLKL